MTSMQSVDTFIQKYISINCEKFIQQFNEFIFHCRCQAYVQRCLLYDDNADRIRYNLLGSEGVWMQSFRITV